MNVMKPHFFAILLNEGVNMMMLARALLDDFICITYMLEENQCSGIFNFLSVLQPSFLCGFKRAIVMGANFDGSHSLMPKL